MRWIGLAALASWAIPAVARMFDRQSDGSGPQPEARRRDPVDEAIAESFPASDPPATW